LQRFRMCDSLGLTMPAEDAGKGCGTASPSPQTLP